MNEFQWKEILIVVMMAMLISTCAILAYKSGEGVNPKSESVFLGSLKIHMGLFETPLNFKMALNNPVNKTLAVRLMVNATPSELSKFAVAYLAYPKLIDGLAQAQLYFAFVVHDNGKNMTGDYVVYAEGV